MNPFNLEQDFNAEQEEQELNFDTIFEDFLNETDTANDDEDFVIGQQRIQQQLEQGQEDTITHIIQLDLFNELNNLNGFNINYDYFDLVVNNEQLLEQDAEDEEEQEQEQYNNDFYRNNDYWGDRPLTPEEDRLDGLHINFPRRNYNEDEDEDDNLLQYILDDDDVITYDCPMEAYAFYAD